LARRRSPRFLRPRHPRTAAIGKHPPGKQRPAVGTGPADAAARVVVAERRRAQHRRLGPMTTRSASSLIGTTSTAHLPASAPWLRTARYRRPDDAVCNVVLLDDRRHQAPDPIP